MKLSRAFEPLYKSSILNYESTLSRDEIYQDPSYLFIHTNNENVEQDLAYLTAWKHQKGFEVATHSVNSGTSFVTIKAYIQDAYNNWENPPEYICLVGDAEGSYNIATDFNSYGGGDQGYVRLDGTDILADAIIGRLSFQYESELQTIIYKILNYEKIPFMTQTDWYEKAVLVGDPSHSGTSTIDTNQHVKEMMLQYNSNYTFSEYYSGSYASGMSSSLNSGVSYLNYRGYMGMSGFDNNSIYNLNNGFMLPYAVFPTCATGSFTNGTSRSEQFIRVGSPGSPKGAVAAYGTATTSTHTCFNNIVDAGTYYGIFTDKIFTPGGSLNRGKVALYMNYPQNPGGAVNSFSYWNNLMGDPGMELWTGIPQNLVVTYEDDLALGTNNLLVTVTDESNIPLENAWVTALMGDDDIFVSGYTNEDGSIMLEINAEVEGSADLTVTKHDYIPHLGSFDVGEVDRFVNVLEYSIDDDNTGDSSGNDDGIVNPGETIELILSLKNFGTMIANGVEAVISTEDNFITITDNLETYGNIAAGTSVSCSEDYDFSVDPSVVGGMEILLVVEIEDDMGNQWIDYVTIPVEGANLYVSDFNYPNGLLVPGSTGQLELTIDNPGTVGADNIYGVLSTDNNWITIEDDQAFFGNVAAGGQATCTSDRFEITAAAMIIPGTQLTLEMQLYNADGYDSIVYFMITVGEAELTDPLGPDAYGYYCYDDGDIDYYNVPVYNWEEINSIGTNLNLNDSGQTGDIEDISNLPITFRFYGEEYNSLTVCSNGWIAPGNTDNTSFMNWQIPGPQGPSPMIAAFWDDLKTGDVYYYYNSALNYFVVEWDDMTNQHVPQEETFQIIIYDANFYPTATGDSEIKIQYKVFNNVDVGSYPSNHGQYCTVGIEDHTGTRGLEYTFNNSYPATAKQLNDETAILFTGPPIQFEQPYLVLGGITLNDENGNGLADFGEIVNINVMLNNLGESSATGVTAVITGSDPNTTITQNSAGYNNITGNASGTNITPFTIEIAEDCPDGHIAPFIIDVSSNEDNWQLHFTIELNAPVIEFNSIFVDDGANNILDPGETADIYVSFMNSGGSDATNVLTELSESDPYVTLNSTNHTFTILNAGNISTAMFNVTASATAPVGHLAVINWTMSGDTNFNADGTFDLVISQVPVLLDEDFSGAYPPNGWTLTGMNTGNWSQSTTNNAGGSSPESKLNWNPSFTGESRLVSPVMNTAGSTTLDFEFQHHLNDFAGSQYAIGVRTTSDGGSTWNTAWEISPTGNVGPELQQLSVSTPDVGSQNFQIAFVFDGYSYNINYWYIDNIHLEGGQGTALGFIDGEVTLEGGTGNVEDVILTA
ncbi:MAG: hypothetical protein DRI23_09070, partial [Candidatus Cloacimonadota bacterium]